MATVSLLPSDTWRGLELPPLLEQFPTMLAHDERRLLHWLARDVWEGWGAIVDAGCFLGGSTASFATGLRARTQPRADGPAPPMWTYDRFQAEQYMIDAGYFERWPAIASDGDSFQPAFEELLGDLVDETRVCAGDMTTAGWSGGPIEILFLDVLKNTTLNDRISRDFMPSLVPGRSVLIQQDYVHGMLPWIHITMELLADAVKHVVDVSASRVYAVTGAIDAERLDAILPLDERVPRARQQELMAQAVERSSGPTRGSVLLAQANLLRMHGELDRAAAIVDDVERTYADAPSVMFDVEPTRFDLAQAGWLARG